MTRIRTERREGALLVTLDAPEKRNAIDLEMVQALHAVLDEHWEDDSITAMVLTGAGGKAFAAGADIGQLRQRRSQDALRAINSALFQRIEDFPRPVIAAIVGYALGGGCELALCCDLRIAGESARMGQPEVKLGIIPAAGGCYRLPRIVGLGVAKEMIYTGRILDAGQCLRIGLVNEVVTDDRVLDRALELAAEIGANGAMAVRMAKAVIHALARPGQEAAQPMESAAQAILFDSADKDARMAAFLDKGNKNKKKRES